MDTLESIAARIATTEDIRAIVRTMKSLSAVSIRRYEHASAAIADYADAVEYGLRIVLYERRNRGLGIGAAGGPAPGARPAMIVLGSDRGLCGRFNDRIAEFAAAACPAGPGKRPLLGVLGLRAAARLEAAGYRPDAVLPLPVSVGGIAACVQAVLVQIDRWRQVGHAGAVYIAFNRRTEEALAWPVERQLLPLPKDYLQALAARAWTSPSLPMFTMEPEAMLAWLVREHLFVAIYRAIAESLASEHGARLSAMQRAERSIDDRLEGLSAEHRQKRQEAITLELLDVIAGFEAAGAEA